MDVLKRVNRARLAVLIIFLALAASIFAAPYTLPSDSLKDLSGKVGTIDNQRTIDSMNNPFAQIVYTIGDWNCHQISSRSLYLNGNEMPVCARDTGILIGLIAGMAGAIVFNPRFKWLYIIAALIPMALDGGVQLFSSYESTNEVRILTGMMAGIAGSLVLSHVAWTSMGYSDDSGNK